MSVDTARVNAIEQSPPGIDVAIPRREVPCNACGSLTNRPFCPENGRGLVACDKCGLVYVSHQPDPQVLYDLYGENYFHNNDSGTVGYTNYLADEQNIRKTFARRLKYLDRFIQPGNLLDIGCAAGFFLDEANRRGWSVQGLDVSGFAVNYVTDRFGFDARQGSILDLDYPENHYDLITMWDVIEHVPDPMSQIEKVASLLRPGGVFALATPDVDSLPAQITGKRWVGYKLSEEHVYYVSVKTLSNMLDRAGFDVIHTYHVGKYVTISLFLNRLSMYLPFVARIGQALERIFKLSEKSAYINPFDIIAVTARKR